ncbi:helix-turn-helix transcriptional regulator [Myxococcota bacterium]
MLTTAQVAELIGIKCQTLRRWRMTGVGPKYHRLGSSNRGPCRYSLRHINEWLELRVFRSTSAEIAAKRTHGDE